MRDGWGRVLAALLGGIRDFELAEDVLAEAVVAALEHWPHEGIPRRPEAWLLRSARRKAIDRWRSRDSGVLRGVPLETLEGLKQADLEQEVDEMIPDERLRLIFTCCHPSIAEGTRVALTLNSLGGLTTGEIARAFLLREATVAQRLVRAKRKIKAAGITYEIPKPEHWVGRLESVLEVLYLIYNEGHASTSGENLVREDLCLKSIRLARVLHELMPDEGEVSGLLALLLLHDSRRAARSGVSGELVTLEFQDRTRWDRQQNDEGERLLAKALQAGGLGPYQVQAAISAVHNGSTTFEETDWRQIVLLYERLYRLQPTAVVRLNGVVALSMLEGPRVGLNALEQLNADGTLENYQAFHAARADFHRQLSERPQAAAAYGRALELTHNSVERRFFESRLDEVSG